MKIVDLLYCTLIIYLKIIKVHSNNDINKNQSNNLINTNHQFFKNSLSIQQAYIIALDTLSAKYTAKQALHYLNIPNITIFPAINGTAALQQMPPLSLYTQYLLYYHTRHDHMQLSTAPMLGCLLSHIHLWTQAIEMNQSLIAIFEEDAIFDEMSNERLQGLLLDLNKNNTIWDILMLESGSVLAQGP
jgi:GR25 family glycosyltransferase involved in LPS biosynthesis